MRALKKTSVTEGQENKKGEEGDEEDDVCVVCGEGWSDKEMIAGSSKLLLLCDGCDQAFHLQCVGEYPQRIHT